MLGVAGSLMGALFRHRPMQPGHSLCNPSADQSRLEPSHEICLIRLVQPTQAETGSSGQFGNIFILADHLVFANMALAFEICTLASRPMCITSGRLVT